MNWPAAGSSTISIHAPREGGDREMFTSSRSYSLFQSTPPARGATTITGYNVWYTYISIHAPREGGDVSAAYPVPWNKYISIHAPREGGDVFMAALLTSLGISIHAPREGGDSKDAQFYL